MNRDTFGEYSSFAVDAAETRSKSKLELTDEERAQYESLAEMGKLLEQERIPNVYSGPRILQAISG